MGAARRSDVVAEQQRREAEAGVEDLKALRAYDRTAVQDSMERRLRYEPMKTSRSGIKRLVGIRRPQYRLRVGGVRVFYDVTQETVEVLSIIPKSEAAAWLERYAERGPSEPPESKGEQR